MRVVGSLPHAPRDHAENSGAVTFSRAAYIFLRAAYIFLRAAYIFLRAAYIFLRAAVTFSPGLNPSIR